MNNDFWKGYAERAFIIPKGNNVQGKDYKALVRSHCIPSFTDLGTLNGGKWGRVSSVNFDGSEVLGYADDGTVNQERDFRWTAAERMVSLGTFNKQEESSAKAISFDGSVTVGFAEDDQGKGVACRWTAKGIEFLGPKGDSTDWNQWVKLNTSLALCVNHDGSVIAGVAGVYAFSPDHRAFRWTEEKGMGSVEELLKAEGLLPPHWTLTRVKAMTPSGAVLVGEGRDNRIKIDDIEDEVPLAWRAVIPRRNLF